MDISSINSQVNNILNPLLDPRIRPVIALFLVVYAGFIAPKLPQDIQNWFTHPFFRIAVMSLIIWTANRDPILSVLIAVVFLIIVNLANGKKFWEGFEGPETAVYPGCFNITVYDLLESFNNDKNALLAAMQSSRIPMDVKLTDYYAPLIGTYLMNKGFILKGTCSPPGTDSKMTSWTA